jgi:TPR repeat protein
VGNAVGQLNLGLLHQSGQGTPQNFFEAAKWYNKAALQGNEVAQYNLGLLYEAGQGVPKDSAEAVRWIRMAAEKGYGPAQNNLGAKYAAGDGVPKDIVEAHVWFNLAGVKGNAAALRNLSIIERDMNGEQRSSAMETARKRFAGPTKQLVPAAEALKGGSIAVSEKPAGNAPAAPFPTATKTQGPNSADNTKPVGVPQK